MFRTNWLRNSLFLAVTSALVAGCNGSSSGSDTGRLSLNVTDAPVDSASKVVVSFSGVELQSGGSRTEILFDEPRTIDLLALQGSNSANLLEGQELPAGEYQWMRLLVNAEQDSVLDSYIEFEDGSVQELSVPSGSQTGLKLVRGFTLLAGGSADFTIDFDLRKSVVDPKGGQGMHLKPALRLIDNAQSGTITGTVAGELIASACADASLDAGAVYAFVGSDVVADDVDGDAGDPLTSALVNENAGVYSYELGFMPVGTYTLAYTCEAATDDPESDDVIVFAEQANAEVVVDQTTQADFSGI